jgi:hypothetical protein
MATYYKEGDTPNAAGLNKPYSDTASLSITNKNTRRDWATRKHFDKSGDLINETYFVSSNTTPQFTTTSSTFSTISVGGQSASIAINETPTNDTLFRVNWDILVAELTLADDSTSANNMYVFRVKVSLNSGGTIKYISSASYSYNIRSHTTLSPALTPTPINWRSCAGSGLLIVAGGSTIDSVEIEAATGGGGSNTLVVDRFNLVVVEARQ